MDTTRTPLPGIPAGLFFGIIAHTYKLIPKQDFGFGIWVPLECKFAYLT
ncbi:hypothetical protein [Marinobacter antarcticus]|nr:hypothetical protein [Marinobacter antarcticus]